jgi:hypothetical protein
VDEIVTTRARPPRRPPYDHPEDAEVARHLVALAAGRPGRDPGVHQA